MEGRVQQHLFRSLTWQWNRRGALLILLLQIKVLELLPRQNIIHSGRRWQDPYIHEIRYPYFLAQQSLLNHKTQKMIVWRLTDRWPSRLLFPPSRGFSLSISREGADATERGGMNIAQSSLSPVQSTQRSQGWRQERQMRNPPPKISRLGIWTGKGTGKSRTRTDGKMSVGRKDHWGKSIGNIKKSKSIRQDFSMPPTKKCCLELMFNASSYVPFLKRNQFSCLKRGKLFDWLLQQTMVINSC